MPRSAPLRSSVPFRRALLHRYTSHCPRKTRLPVDLSMVRYLLLRHGTARRVPRTLVTRAFLSPPLPLSLPS